METLEKKFVEEWGGMDEEEYWCFVERCLEEKFDELADD